MLLSGGLIWVVPQEGPKALISAVIISFNLFTSQLCATLTRVTCLSNNPLTQQLWWLPSPTQQAYKRTSQFITYCLTLWTPPFRLLPLLHSPCPTPTISPFQQKLRVSPTTLTTPPPACLSTRCAPAITLTCLSPLSSGSTSSPCPWSITNSRRSDVALALLFSLAWGNHSGILKYSPLSSSLVLNISNALFYYINDL